jgi:hypothetical protein
LRRTPAALPPLDRVEDKTPLRLDVAARIFFPDGSITGRSLEREAGRNNLDVMHIAGKTFTTLADIARMCERCRVPSSRLDCISASPAPTAPPSGSSSTAASSTALARARRISRELKQRSPNISAATRGRASGKVIPIKS